MATDWDDIFEEEARRRLQEIEALEADPAFIQRETERRRNNAERIDREIAEGLRDADGGGSKQRMDEEGKDLDES